MRLLAIAMVLLAGCGDDSAQTGGDASVMRDLAAPADATFLYDSSWLMDGGVPAVCQNASGGDDCSPDTQYCYWLSGGGAHGPNPAPHASTACMQIPSACLPNPTCACLLANASGFCPQCYSSGKQLVLMCEGI